MQRLPSALVFFSFLLLAMATVMSATLLDALNTSGSRGVTG
jgi:hypothetical protein